MAVTSEGITTVRGDRVQVTLFEHADEEATILVTVIDVDETLVPTAEFTIEEAAALRELFRQLCEQATRGGAGFLLS